MVDVERCPGSGKFTSRVSLNVILGHSYFNMMAFIRARCRKCLNRNSSWIELQQNITTWLKDDSVCIRKPSQLSPIAGNKMGEIVPSSHVWHHTHTYPQWKEKVNDSTENVFLHYKLISCFSAHIIFGKSYEFTNKAALQTAWDCRTALLLLHLQEQVCHFKLIDSIG